VAEVRLRLADPASRSQAAGRLRGVTLLSAFDLPIAWIRQRG